MTVATVSQTGAASAQSATQSATAADFNTALTQAQTTSASSQTTPTPSQSTLDATFVSDFVAVIEPLLLNQLDDMLGDAFTGGSSNT